MFRKFWIAEDLFGKLQSIFVLLLFIAFLLRKLLKRVNSEMELMENIRKQTYQYPLKQSILFRGQRLTGRHYETRIDVILHVVN